MSAEESAWATFLVAPLAVLGQENQIEDALVWALRMGGVAAGRGDAVAIVANMMRVAVNTEREDCAQIAYWRDAEGEAIASEIRARSDKT